MGNIQYGPTGKVYKIQQLGSYPTDTSVCYVWLYAFYKSLSDTYQTLGRDPVAF